MKQAIARSTLDAAVGSKHRLLQAIREAIQERTRLERVSVGWQQLGGDQNALEALRAGYCRVHSVRTVHLPPNLVPPIIRLDVSESSGLPFVGIASDRDVDFNEAVVKVHCQHAQNAILRYGPNAGASTGSEFTARPRGSVYPPSTPRPQPPRRVSSRADRRPRSAFRGSYSGLR